MQFFSSRLLFHTLRNVLAELESPELDPNNPSLVQLKATLSQHLAELAASHRSYGPPRMY